MGPLLVTVWLGIKGVMGPTGSTGFGGGSTGTSFGMQRVPLGE